jgi:hypothetical protein
MAPERCWNFVEINVPFEEAMDQKQHIVDLMYPLDTVMDLVRRMKGETLGLLVTLTHSLINNGRVSPWLYGLLPEEKVIYLCLLLTIY